LEKQSLHRVGAIENLAAAGRGLCKVAADE